MKLLVVFPFIAGLLASSLYAADSAYSNATLDLTSTASQEYATANATSGVGYADSAAQPGQLSDSFSTAASSGAALSFQDESVSGFTDTLTINGPGMTGSAGTVDFNFLVSGTDALAAVAPASSSLTAIASFVFTSTTDTLTYTQYSDGASSGVDFLNTPQTIVIPFTFGKPFTISLQLDFQALVSGLTAGSASVSGSFSTVASTDDVVALVQSTPLSNFSEKSASGANYITPLTVPEPSDFLLPALALVGLLPLVKKTRHLAE